MFGSRLEEYGEEGHDSKDWDGERDADDPVNLSTSRNAMDGWQGWGL